MGRASKHCSDWGSPYIHSTANIDGRAEGVCSVSVSILLALRLYRVDRW
jgi:hypothetical protein